MAWILGLDVGEKRIGAALANTETQISSPYAMWLRAKGQAEQEVLNLVQEKNIQTVVVGIPRSATGQKTPQCERVEAFCRRLQKRCSIEVVYVDEYLTSEEAKERLGLSAKDQRKKRESGMLDAVSASIILQSYLDENRRGS